MFCQPSLDDNGAPGGEIAEAELADREPRKSDHGAADRGKGAPDEPLRTGGDADNDNVHIAQAELKNRG
jgi:hypothetical protein